MKLTGLKVIDLSLFLPGPYLTLALCDHGAEVIKVEPPAGDPGRGIGERQGGHAVFFRNLNRGKQSLCLDLKLEADRERLLRLCDEADVFVESFRPGVAARLGFGQETLRGRNPRLVYCSISAFGQDGDYAARPAHDLGVEAMAGVLSMSLGPDGSPAIPAIPVADVLSGLHGLSGVLMALLRRESTGQGDYLDISMLDSTVGACLNILGPTLAEGRQPDPREERTTGGSAFYRVYRTGDGGHISMAGQEPKFVHCLLGALGRPELAELVLQGPGRHQQPVVDYLTGVFLTRTRDEWDAWLGGLDVCYGPVKTLPEALADPHLARRAMVLTDDAGLRHIGSPIHFADEPAEPDFTVPALGGYAGPDTHR
ncbi:CoA transferase [Xylophilus rhododendri]|uniref:CoA transferase n=1 Tax=Xylophilus rhododendri TaxID=2697032 RepID=A0A857J028_9BURK|nr:CoA transferase [Xylophilus rhododendri]QHI97210.1 CoA transferase [Xylophilus rhododendri]